MFAQSGECIATDVGHSRRPSVLKMVPVVARAQIRHARVAEVIYENSAVGSGSGSFGYRPDMPVNSDVQELLQHARRFFHAGVNPEVENAIVDADWQAVTIENVPI